VADTGLRVRFSPIKGFTSRDTIRLDIYLPAVLGEITLEEEGAHTDYETIRAGEFSVPRFGDKRSHRMLRTVDVETITLYWKAKWLHPSSRRGTGWRYLGPDAIEDALYRILRSREPVEMLMRIHQIGWDDAIVKMGVTFRSISQTIKPGEADAKYWTISIKEWRKAGLARRVHPGSGYRGVELPIRHRLEEGDTLESLARTYYGNTAGWRKIANENGIVKWGASTPLVESTRFRVGSGLKIPDLPLVGVGSAIADPATELLQ
jgi:phage tail protein X